MSIGWRSKGKLILGFDSQDLNCDLKKCSQCVIDAVNDIC